MSTRGPERARGGGRSTELGLLVLAAVATVGAYALASLGQTARLPADTGLFLAAVLGLELIAHLATRRWAGSADQVIVPLVAFLNGLGFVIVARLDPNLAGLQAAWTALGVGAFVVTLAALRHTAQLERYRYLAAAGGLGLMLLPLLPVVGQNINGARLWLRVGPVSFQPVELGKIALIVFFASYLVEKREVLASGRLRLARLPIPDLRAFGPILAAWALALVIMTAERDIGFSMLMFSVFVAMVWIATQRRVYLAAGAGMFSAGALGAYYAFGHVRQRVLVWLNPWPHATGAGYQSVQATFAFAAGGVAGTGLGLGQPTRIPVVVSDYIFAAIGEELGLAGTIFVASAFLLLVGAGLRAAINARSEFAALLAAGLAGLLGLQAFFIMAGVTRLLPLTGVTLPFVSYGGSSLLANYVLVAVLIRISDESRATLPVPAR